jgi:hypothetical protein
LFVVLPNISAIDSFRSNLFAEKLKIENAAIAHNLVDTVMAGIASRLTAINLVETVGYGKY